MLTTMYTQEVLIKLLCRKGVITEDELLEEIKKKEQRVYSFGVKRELFKNRKA